jgi:hypothetical protein
MAAVRVRGNFEQAWAMAHDEVGRRSAERQREALSARYPDGQLRGVEPYRSSLDRVLALTSATVREWRRDRQGFAYLGSRDRGVSIPPPRDAETFAIGLHEAMHHALDRRGAARDTATSWGGEVDVWRAALRWFRAEDLPGIDQAQRRAVECLRTRPEARRFGRATLAHVLGEDVGSPIRETPAAQVLVYR